MNGFPNRACMKARKLCGRWARKLKSISIPTARTKSAKPKSLTHPCSSEPGGRPGVSRHAPEPVSFAIRFEYNSRVANHPRYFVAVFGDPGDPPDKDLVKSGRYTSSGTVCLRSRSSTSARTFAPRFFQTPPRDDALALRYDFTSIRLSKGLSPSSCRTCSAHQRKAQARQACASNEPSVFLELIPEVLVVNLVMELDLGRLHHCPQQARAAIGRSALQVDVTLLHVLTEQFLRPRRF